MGFFDEEPNTAGSLASLLGDKSPSQTYDLTRVNTMLKYLDHGLNALNLPSSVVPPNLRPDNPVWDKKIVISVIYCPGKTEILRYHVSCRNLWDEYVEDAPHVTVNIPLNREIARRLEKYVYHLCLQHFHDEFKTIEEYERYQRKVAHLDKKLEAIKLICDKNT